MMQMQMCASIRQVIIAIYECTKGSISAKHCLYLFLFAKKNNSEVIFFVKKKRKRKNISNFTADLKLFIRNYYHIMLTPVCFRYMLQTGKKLVEVGVRNLFQ